jgi:iron-sulfur cluster assembly accessory protein
MIMETLINIPVQFTESAIKEIKRLMTVEGFDQSSRLRVGVKGGGCSGMTYVLEFDQPTEKDETFTIHDVECIIDKSHTLYLAGMEVEWEGGLNSRGFTFKNPNASSTCGCGTSFAV